MPEPHQSESSVPPLTPGFLPNIRYDLLSGFLVFLIAMPLCLGIAKASNYPPIMGLWTAVVGGILCCVLGGPQLTIKGPAAGMIVIVAGAVLELGAELVPDLTPDQVTSLVAETGKTASEINYANEKQIEAGYPLSLGIGVVAGVIQILFGLFRIGRLGELVPLTPVHGMMAAIGITIMAKSFFTMIGLPAPGGEPST